MGLELREYGVEQQNPQHFDAWRREYGFGGGLAGEFHGFFDW